MHGSKREKQEASTKQLSATEALTNPTQYEKDLKRWKETTDTIAYYIAKDKAPIATVEHGRFKRLIKTLNKRYTLPLWKYCSQTAIPDMHKTEIHSALCSHNWFVVKLNDGTMLESYFALHSWGTADENASRLLIFQLEHVRDGCTWLEKYAFCMRPCRRESHGQHGRQWRQRCESCRSQQMDAGTMLCTQVAPGYRKYQIHISFTTQCYNVCQQYIKIKIAITQVLADIKINK